MSEQASLTKEALKAALVALVDERANERLLTRLSEPAILDWLITMIRRDMDRIEQKQKEGPSIRA